MPKLHLSPDLVLPLDAATRRLAILAMSGAGKSNVAVVLAEQMFDAGIPWVAIDPKGDWWGVRSSGDGKGPGLPIPIIGGLHGDVPLEPSAGKVIAEMIVEQRMTCVLDISEFEDRQKQWGFLIDLGETLLRRNRQVLHLFLEEADEYLPQRTSEKGNLPRCLGVWQRVVKRGRFRGIGSTQITQRNASLNKDTLYQAEALIAMRASGKADREAVRGWVEYHNAGDEIVASLPTLADGEGWVSSPAWLKLTQRVRFDRRRTFDSGATPVLLKGSAAPATLADVDMAVLRERMAATIERAKADDPKELRKEIATLRKQLAGAPVKTVEKAVADERAADRAVKAALDQAARDARALSERNRRGMKSVRDHLADYQTRLSGIAARIATDIEALDAMIGELSVREMASTPALPVNPGITVSTFRTRVPAAALPKRTEPVGDLSRGQQKILNALAEMESLGIPETNRSQLGMWAGYNLTGGTGAQHIADLNAKELIELPGAGKVRLTDAGRASADAADAPSTLEELHARVLAKLPEGQQRIARYLIAHHPREFSRAELGEATGYNLTGGTGAQHVADLITVGAARIPGPGRVVANDLLFPEGLS